MKKSIKLFKAISKMCDAIILKLDKKEHASFFAETGFSKHEKELMTNISIKTEKAVKASLSKQYRAIEKQIEKLKELSKEKKLVTKAEASDEDTQKQIDIIVALILAFIFIRNDGIGDVITTSEKLFFLSLAQSSLKEMGYKGDVEKRADELFKDWSAQYNLFISGVLNDSTKQTIRKIVERTVRNNIGSSLTDIMIAVEDNIKHSFGKIDERSANIAQNETLRVGNAVLFMCAVLGGKKQKTWVTMKDSHVRPAHKKAEGQTVGINDYFIVDGESLKYPLDPAGSASNTMRCRCWVVYS